MKKNLSLLSSIVCTFLFITSCISPNEIKMTDNQGQDSLKDTSIYSPDMEKQNLEEGKASYLLTKIVFPAGRIRIESAETGIVEGSFKNSNDEWKPQLTYTENGDTGNIKIEPKSTVNNINFVDNDTSRWILGLNKNKYYEIDMEVGACQGDLNMEGLLIKNFTLGMGAGSVYVNLKNTSIPKIDISVGAGKAVVDLTGIWNNNLVAKIAGGVGEIEIHLPKNVGIKAEVNGLLGGVEAEGFTKKHNKYTNNAFGKTEFSLDIEIDGAIGEVRLIQD